MWLVWNHESKGEAVAFDNPGEAYQTSTGNFEMMGPAIGEAFFQMYEDNAPLPVEEITI